MNFKLSYLVKLVLLVVCAWGGWTVYGYFLDRNTPQVNLVGLEDGGYYCNDMQCIVSGQDSYKVADVSVWLDGKPLVNKYKINQKQFDYELPIDTRTVKDGKHNLRIEVCDGTFNCNKRVLDKEFFVDNVPLQAAFVKPESDSKVLQGRTLHLQFQVNKPIKTATASVVSKTYECHPEDEGSSIFEAYVPLRCEEKPSEYPLSVEIEDKVGNKYVLDSKFQITPGKFKRQALHVDSKKFAKQKELGRRQLELENQLEDLVKKSPNQKMWQGVFYVPIDSTGVVSAYGVQRITQEKGCYAHKAIDLIAMPKAVVWAPQNGKVIVKDRFAESGNTVVIDHGLGVFSLLFHLEDFADINVGDKIRRGNPVGRMGKTGYASGYHLHWEMRVNNVHTDPDQWVKNSF